MSEEHEELDFHMLKNFLLLEADISSSNEPKSMINAIALKKTDSEFYRSIYFERPEEENTLRRLILKSNEPLAIQGTAGCGKTTLLLKVLYTINSDIKSSGIKGKCVRIDINDTFAAILKKADPLKFQEIFRVLDQKVGSKLLVEHLPPVEKLGEFLEYVVKNYSDIISRHRDTSDTNVNLYICESIAWIKEKLKDKQNLDLKDSSDLSSYSAAISLLIYEYYYRIGINIRVCIALDNLDIISNRNQRESFAEAANALQHALKKYGKTIVVIRKEHGDQQNVNDLAGFNYFDSFEPWTLPGISSSSISKILGKRFYHFLVSSGEIKDECDSDSNANIPTVIPNQKLEALNNCFKYVAKKNKFSSWCNRATRNMLSFIGDAITSMELQSRNISNFSNEGSCASEFYKMVGRDDYTTKLASGHLALMDEYDEGIIEDGFLGFYVPNMILTRLVNVPARKNDKDFPHAGVEYRVLADELTRFNVDEGLIVHSLDILHGSAKHRGSFIDIWRSDSSILDTENKYTGTMISVTPRGKAYVEELVTKYNYWRAIISNYRDDIVTEGENLNESELVMNYFAKMFKIHVNTIKWLQIQRHGGAISPSTYTLFKKKYTIGGKYEIERIFSQQKAFYGSESKVYAKIISDYVDGLRKIIETIESKPSDAIKTIDIVLSGFPLD